MAFSVAFTYDGGATLTATITDPTASETYSLFCLNGSGAILGTPDSGSTVGSSLVLTVPDVAGFTGINTFVAVVQDATDYVGTDVFQQGSVSPFVFGETWVFDGNNLLEVTFASVLARYYEMDAVDTVNGINFVFDTGTGASLTLTMTAASNFGGDCWYAQLIQYDGVYEMLASRVFKQGVASSGTVFCSRPAPPVITCPTDEPPLWRFAVTNLAGSTLTFLDHLASERVVTPKLNEALEVSGTVPSDNPEVNIPGGDGFPFVAEGVRQLYCFRRESDCPPYYTVRASTLIMQINDASGTGDARSRFTAWDPWQYLFSRPVLQSSLATTSKNTPGIDGRIIGPAGLTYPATMTANQILMDMIFVTMAAADVTAPVAARDGFLDYGQFGVNSTNYEEACGTFTDGYPIQQGTMLGQAMTDLTATGYLDIILRPIYDPVNRPGILCALEIYSQSTLANNYGAGSLQYDCIFAWDRPGRSLTGIDNLYDGVGRANYIQFYTGQGGPPVPAAYSPSAISTYGEYWSQQFHPAQPNAVPAVLELAKAQVVLRANFKETLTINPSPERALQPFRDYYLGDGVPVYASTNLRQQLGLPQAWQRIFGIPVEIDDNGTEMVRQLICGPVGGPVIGPEPALVGAPSTTIVAVSTARRTNRQGGVGP